MCLTREVISLLFYGIAYQTSVTRYFGFFKLVHFSVPPFDAERCHDLKNDLFSSVPRAPQ